MKATETGYKSIHQWLRRKHPKAKQCSVASCPQKSKHFDWALKKGFKHDRNISNYQEMCRSCHRLYDEIKTVPGYNRVQGEDRASVKLNNKKVRVIKHMLKECWYDVSMADIARAFNVSTTTISSIKKGKTWKHITI